MKEAESFVYLRSVIDKQGGTDRDMAARIGKAIGSFVTLKNTWAAKEINLKTKLRVFNSNVKTVLLYGCEIWRKTKKILQRIQTFINSCLRRIYHIRWQDKIRNEDF